MSEFSINDKRHSNPQRLITSNLSSELDAAKKGLPLNHTAEEDKRAMRASRFRKQAETSGSSGGMQIAYPKTREPFGTWEDKGIPHNMADEEDRMKLRSWTRAYYTTHNLVSTAVDVYSRFPVQGMELKCLSGETKVVTWQGLREIADITGTHQRILTTGGVWTDAKFGAFGKQHLRKITLSRNRIERVIFATGEHRWFIQEQNKIKRGTPTGAWSALSWDIVDQMREMHNSGEYLQKDLGHIFNISQVMVSKIVNKKAWTDKDRAKLYRAPGWHKKEITTDDLRMGDRLVQTYGNMKMFQVTPSPFGIARGMVWGDGSLTAEGSGSGSYVDLFGEKDRSMLQYFNNCGVWDFGPNPDRAVQSIRVHNLPRYFKSQLPDIDESAGYLYGWLAGYFAADGHVTEAGQAVLTSHDEASIIYSQTLCRRLGIKTYDVREYLIKDQRLPSGEIIHDVTRWELPIRISSLSREFFCIDEHRRRFDEFVETDHKELDSWIVENVEATDRFEEVYCAVVPGAEAFVLDGDILTGNSKSDDLTEFYTQLFMNEEQLDYENFVVDLGKEYHVTGEVTSFANFNDELGVWDAEEILNPDSIEARKNPFTREIDLKLGVPEYLQEIIRTCEPRNEYMMIAEQYPELIQAVLENKRMSVSNVLIARTINKVSAWDVYGTPHMMRAFRPLLQEESLNAAQDAVADRLYAPFVLAKMGLQDIGDGEPWIPTPDELDAFTSQIQLALAADFRMLVHHLGVDIKSVFGRETVPNFSGDYDRLERKILQVWGIGESLLSGSTSGTYASAALNRDLVTQLMSDWQKKVQRHYRKRALIVAEAQGHFDYEVRGGIHYPIYDEFIQVDPENGREYIVKKPRLLIPDINFASINMNDEDKERSFLQQLANAGVPISNQALMVNIPFDFEDELERKAEEEIKKTISRAETKKRALEVMQARGLLKYADPDLQQLAANPEEMVSPDAVPLQNLDQSSDGTDTGDGTNSTKPDAVNLNKDHSFEEINNMGVPEQDRTELSDQTSPRAESAPKTLPRNEVGTRPEISDEKRKDSPMPRSATRFVEDPWHVGKSALLSEESVQELIQNRPWRRSLGKED